MEDKPHKLRVRLGNAEFEAEGDESIVKEQYNMFLKALPHAQHVVEERPAHEEASGNSGDHGDVDDGLLQRVFSTERGVISLRVLPDGKSREADALLLLIYGHMKLKGEHAVFGTQLMKSARQSGLNIERVDRIISAHKSFYMRGGARRGAKYTLNNQGINKVRHLIREMYG